LASAKPGIDPESVPRGAPRILAGFLVSYVDARGVHWPIFQGSNTVGRRGNDGVDVPIDDATTSSRHACLLASACPGRIKLEDLGSTNGTFVGPTRLVAGQRRELSDGDQVRFGGFSVIVKII
jgi:pSer/pThr/pTyr-binding forkhead associated (FHA) protein